MELVLPRALKLLKWAGKVRHPTFVFGAILILVIWVTAIAKVRFEMKELKREAASEVKNYALLFEQDVLRTSTELDRIIRFLRRSYEQTGYTAAWASLISDDFAINARTVQIAIIDKNGLMITSSALLHPKTPVDLSDRAHFRYHQFSGVDALHISEPILGRASKRWAVQFTRRFSLQDGSFGGVIVVSLDPQRLLSTYEQLESKRDWAFALIGKDDVIRSGAGIYGNQLGRDYWSGVEQGGVETNSAGVSITREAVGGAVRVVGRRAVGDLPLYVIVSIEELHLSGAALLGVEIDYYVSAALTLLVVFSLVRSITLDHRHVRRITDIAHHDALTGLQNRLSFQRKFNKLCLATPSARTFSIHLIDLDRFKAVNDTFGHAVGDQLLIEVGARLRKSVRQNDEVFRLGGDEFAMIQSNDGAHDSAAAIAQRLCDVLGGSFDILGHRISIGASIGIALGSTDGLEPLALQQAADAALYLAKSEGRGTFRFFNAELGEFRRRRGLLEMELAAALERDELLLHYQPKVSVGPEPRVIGYEALVRWNHPERGMLPPAEFIVVAEETGLIVPIGEWILRRTCQEFASQPDDLTVAVNCSVFQFSSGSLVSAVKEALCQSGLRAQRLEIEITESMLMRDEKSILSQLHDLRALGVTIALDDFGTGYSSLSYLHTYPIDCIKIDRSFVKTLGLDRSAGPIIRAIVTMARELGMTTVGEGVETQAQLDELTASGCDCVQGYLFSPPRVLKDFAMPIFGVRKAA
jgi:diguanylate cyclase (GGDEF)-like protein